MLAIKDISNKSTFDLETGVRVTWATSVPILVFLGLSVLELGPMYVTDKQMSDVRQTSDKTSLNASALWGRRQTTHFSEANYKQ